eukprot:scaffold1197_cov168-Chaetoceros_neogracile.AAC.3
MCCNKDIFGKFQNLFHAFLFCAFYSFLEFVCWNILSECVLCKIRRKRDGSREFHCCVLYCTLREPVLARTGAVFRANLFLELLLRWYHYCIELDDITR